MQLLEEQAYKIAEEAAKDQPKKSMTFVKWVYNIIHSIFTPLPPSLSLPFLCCRSDEATAEMEELAKASANPDEINIASDDEEEVTGGVEGV